MNDFMLLLIVWVIAVAFPPFAIVAGIVTIWWLIELIIHASKGKPL